MSVNSECPSGQEKSKDQKNVEILEPGVSIIKPSRRHKRSVAILSRIFFSVLFLGIGVLAVFYSIKRSEEHQDEEADYKHNITQSDFDVYHSQVSLDGKLTIERNSSNGEREFIKYDIAWLQDESHSRLFFNVSDPQTGSFNAFYVFQNHTLNITSESGCEFMHIGYNIFMKRFGLDGLVWSNNDTVEMNGKFVNVEVFQGTPDFKTFSHYTPLPGYDNGRPRLAFAYAFPKRGATCGWQIYFDAVNDKGDISHTEWIEYWFTDMELKEPDAENFVDYTGHCAERDII